MIHMPAEGGTIQVSGLDDLSVANLFGPNLPVPGQPSVDFRNTPVDAARVQALLRPGVTPAVDRPPEPVVSALPPKERTRLGRLVHDTLADVDIAVQNIRHGLQETGWQGVAQRTLDMGRDMISQPRVQFAAKALGGIAAKEFAVQVFNIPRPTVETVTSLAIPALAAANNVLRRYERSRTAENHPRLWQAAIRFTQDAIIGAAAARIEGAVVSTAGVTPHAYAESLQQQAPSSPDAAPPQTGGPAQDVVSVSPGHLSAHDVSATWDPLKIPVGSLQGDTVPLRSVIVPNQDLHTGPAAVAHPNMDFGVAGAQVNLGSGGASAQDVFAQTTADSAQVGIHGPAEAHIQGVHVDLQHNVGLHVPRLDIKVPDIHVPLPGGAKFDLTGPGVHADNLTVGLQGVHADVGPASATTQGAMVGIDSTGAHIQIGKTHIQTPHIGASVQKAGIQADTLSVQRPGLEVHLPQANVDLHVGDGGHATVSGLDASVQGAQAHIEPGILHSAGADVHLGKSGLRVDLGQTTGSVPSGTASVDDVKFHADGVAGASPDISLKTSGADVTVPSRKFDTGILDYQGKDLKAAWGQQDFQTPGAIVDNEVVTVSPSTSGDTAVAVPASDVPPQAPISGPSHGEVLGPPSPPKGAVEATVDVPQVAVTPAVAPPQAEIPAAGTPSPSPDAAHPQTGGPAQDVLKVDVPASHVAPSAVHQAVAPSVELHPQTTTPDHITINERGIWGGLDDSLFVKESGLSQAGQNILVDAYKDVLAPNHTGILQPQVIPITPENHTEAADYIIQTVDRIQAWLNLTSLKGDRAVEALVDNGTVTQGFTLEDLDILRKLAENLLKK